MFLERTTSESYHYPQNCAEMLKASTPMKQAWARKGILGFIGKSIRVIDYLLPKGFSGETPPPPPIYHDMEKQMSLS